MLLALILCHLSVLVAANPFHKYPFVFLLDVGNEELEKTNSEQIRVSVPGGSVALRYPAIGDGYIISHVRVSGIDFGTDLKANIIDGGPGYKYVVLVFIGNQGVPYDAVVTVNTMINSGFNIANNGAGIDSEGNSYQNEEDLNNSAEDLSDTDVDGVQSETLIQNRNAELMQSSSNVYSYADSESTYEDDEDDDGKDDEGTVSNYDSGSDELTNDDSGDKDEFESDRDQKDIHTQYIDDIDQEDDPTIDVKGVESEEDDDEDIDEESFSSKVDQPSVEDESSVIESNLYSKYEANDHENIGGDVNFRNDYERKSKPVYQEDPLDYEDPLDIGPLYNDEEINNSEDKFRDSNNNNYIDSDDSYAVAY